MATRISMLKVQLRPKIFEEQNCDGPTSGIVCQRNLKRQDFHNMRTSTEDERTEANNDVNSADDNENLSNSRVYNLVIYEERERKSQRILEKVDLPSDLSGSGDTVTNASGAFNDENQRGRCTREWQQAHCPSQSIHKERRE